MQRGTAGRYRILLPKGKGGEEGHTGLSPHGWAWGAALRYTSSSRSLLLCSFIGLFCSLIGLFCSLIGLFCSLLLTYRPLLLIYRPLLLIYRPLLLVHRPLLEDTQASLTHTCTAYVTSYVTSSYLHMSHHHTCICHIIPSPTEETQASLTHMYAYFRDCSKRTHSIVREHILFGRYIGLVDTHVRILQRL